MTTSIMHIDLEVQNHEYYGSKASPYCPDNYVVHSAYRIDRTDSNGTVTVEPTFDVRFNTKQEFLDDVAGEHLWFRIPDDCWLIVAHNAAFEISWFLTYQRQHFEEFLKRGGRVFCTMHSEYIASDFQSMYPSLDETAPKYGGTHKIDGVKLLWEQGALTSEIDPILLRDYLVNGDIPNTALCFYGQCTTFAQRNQMQYVWERMDALLAWAYCEWFGLFVNMPIARKNQEEQEQRIREIKQGLQQYIPKDLPETLDFNFGSDFHMSALVYGGPIKYRKKVPYDPPQYVKYDAYLVRGTEGTFVPCECTDVSGPHNYVVYKAGKNKGLPKVFRVDSDEEKLKWEDDLYFCPGLVNIQELPEVIREKYAERGEFRQARALQDGTPVYSTSTDAMEALARQGFEFCKLVNELAALEKDTGTYYLRTEYNEDGSVKKLSGMLQYVIPQSPDGSGIIHHRLNTCSTVTGRLSGSNPNLQNLPRDGTSRVKQMFTSRYGAEGRITEVDYSALEVVMSCVHTGDRKLLSLLQNGTDMHCYRLAFKEGKTYEEMYNLCHNANGPDYKYWKQQRTDIKPPSFAAQYGATAKGIAFATGCTVEYAQSFLDNEAKLFPDTIGFRAVIKEEVERTGAAGRMYREQADDGSYRIYRIGTWTSPAGARYSFRQKEQWKEVVPGQRKQKVMDYKETEMANYWCQGEAFFLMAVAAGMVLRALLARDWFDNQVCLITNVHDALYLDSANPEVGREASLLVKQCMEDAPKRIHQLWPNYGIIGEVPFPAEAEMGTSMYSKEKVE
ncbi:DNA polymerase I [Klebsiella phage PWKp3]|nr:DNA polymerase I [Klebsiella phage PWKp1]UJD04730.1 DNA polymerase I [Klebsiella phage PWKp3]